MPGKQWRSSYENPEPERARLFAEREKLREIDFGERVESNMKWAEAVAKDIEIGDVARALLAEYGSARNIPEAAAREAIKPLDLEAEQAVALAVVLEKKGERPQKH